MGFFSFFLAWRQLRFEPMRLLVALAGVAFACILIFMQFGFKDALLDSATLLQRTLAGDLYIVHKQSEAIWRTQKFPRERLYQTLSIPGVRDVTAMYVGLAPWKNPQTGVNRTAFIFGIDPRSDVYPIKGLEKARQFLKQNDTILFDELSRPEFGDVKSLLRHGPLTVEINGRAVDVVATFELGNAFSADGNLITNDTTFFSIFSTRGSSGVDVGIISIKPGRDPYRIKGLVEKIMPPDVRVYTKDEYIKSERAYWQNVAPIGYIFNFGAVMGFIVGFIIVYQILFNDINTHIKEYATLKAMGYSHEYLVSIVFWSANFLTILGFIPGYMISSVLYEVVEKSIYINMTMPLSKTIFVFMLVFTMCLSSGFLAVKKLKAANPAEIFS